MHPYSITHTHTHKLKVSYSRTRTNLCIESRKDAPCQEIVRIRTSREATTHSPVGQSVSLFIMKTQLSNPHTWLSAICTWRCWISQAYAINVCWRCLFYATHRVHKVRVSFVCVHFRFPGAKSVCVCVFATISFCSEICLPILVSISFWTLTS